MTDLHSERSFKEQVLNWRMLICVGVGFSSGLPLYLMTQLVPSWLHIDGVSLTMIGALGAIQILYSLKFTWAPLAERYSLSLFGRRRSWMLLAQLPLIICIGSLGFWRPAENLLAVSIISIAIIALSATQDIVLDAFRREILETEGELALGNSINVAAYRVSSLVPGSLGMILIDQISWQANFMIMAAFMLVGVLLALLVKEPKQYAPPPASLRDAVQVPFQEFFQRRSIGPALAVLAFMALYKLGDNMATALASPFYLVMQFTPTQIGAVAKNAALWPSIIGGLVGALVIVKIGINKALWIFGFIQFATIFGYVWLSNAGPDLVILAVVIAGEYLGVGLGTAAFVAFIARETSRLAVATQLAMFTALASLPRVFATSVSGLIVDSIGWTDFFYLSALLAVPGMVLLYWVAPWNGSPPQSERVNHPQ